MITVTPILNKIGKVQATTRVVIGGTTPIDIIIRVMDGTKAHSMEKIGISDAVTPQPDRDLNVKTVLVKL